MRSNISGYILLTLLVMLLFGVISFGDVLNVIFYIIMGIILLILISVIVFRVRMRRIRREMEDRAAGFGQYQQSGRERSGRRTRQDGEVTVERTAASKAKVVRNEVGDYVEYEEIDEEIVQNKE